MLVVTVVTLVSLLFCRFWATVLQGQIRIAVLWVTTVARLVS